ncbi:MAG TPA: ROK family protein [Pirellulales bacterium]
MPGKHAVIRLSEAQMPFFVGVDVGGTNIKIGVVDDEGRPLSSTSIPTEVHSGPQAAIERVAQAIRELLAEVGLKPDQVVRVGLGTPGTMDISRGILLSPGNLPGWWNFPIRDALATAIGLPVTFANDARSAAYGEYWVGSGRVLHSMVLFTLGTGVGGGIIIGDLLVEGENSAGSELGHIIIDYNSDARLCSCGHTGHLEAYASASSVVKRTEEQLALGTPTSLRARLGGGEELSALMIDQEAERGDVFSLEIVLETARYLGIGVVTAMHSIDPQGIVIGGAMTFGQHETATGRNFLERIKEEVRARAFPFLADRTTIDFASLGGDAGFIGAAGLARRAHRMKK